MEIRGGEERQLKFSKCHCLSITECNTNI